MSRGAVRLRNTRRHVSHQQLSAEIIARSVATKWHPARLKWALETVYFTDEPETCLCSHFPIIELCVLRNFKNGGEAGVGNHCVKKFMGLASDKIFVALKRIQRDDEAALNTEAIEYAHRRKWINDWERGFYLDTWRKRGLSGRQMEVLVEINRKVLAAVARDKRHAAR